MNPIGDISSISQVIQLAVAPVFMLAGVGAVLNVLNNRLARAVDRARRHETQYAEATGAERERLHGELRLQARRARIIYWAMAFCTLCALFVCSVVVVQFVNAFTKQSLDAVVAILFVLAMFAMIGALLLMLFEVRIAIATLRLGPP
jgi:hypothetical protein